MTVLAEPRLTTAPRARTMLDAVLDRSYEATALGPWIVEYKAWKTYKQFSPRTVDQYERDLSRAALLFPTLPGEKWTESEIMQAILQFPVPSRPRVEAAHSDFWNKWAKGQAKKRLDNPMEHVPRIRRTTPPAIEVFDQREYDLLLALDNLRDRALMAILLGSGIRRGEAVALTVRDISYDRRELKIRRGKGGKPRVVPIPHFVCATVAELELLEGLIYEDHLWYSERTNQTVRRTFRNKPIGDGTWHRWWERCLREAGVDYRKPHTTRHTYATRYLQNGGRIERLSRILGHSNVSVTDSAYAHLTTADLREDMERVFG